MRAREREPTDAEMSRQLHADESDLALARTVRALSDCLNYRNPQTLSWALYTLASLCTQPLPRAGCSFPTTLAALSPPVSERDLDSKTPRLGDERNHATRSGLDDDGTEAEKATGLRPMQSEPPFVNEGIILSIMEGPNVLPGPCVPLTTPLKQAKRVLCHPDPQGCPRCREKGIQFVQQPIEFPSSPKLTSTCVTDALRLLRRVEVGHVEMLQQQQRPQKRGTRICRRRLHRPLLAIRCPSRHHSRRL